jgi:hypothetical protein
MDKLYRLEFNVKQQCFHFADARDIPNTFGWFTVSENMTEKEYMIYECFLKRDFKEKYSKEYILKSISQLKVFWKELLNINLNIQ